MTLAHRGSASATGSAVTSFNLTVPATALDGDIAIVFVISTGTPDIAPSSTWNARITAAPVIPVQTGIAGGIWGAARLKAADASATIPVRPASGSSGSATAGIVVLSGTAPKLRVAYWRQGSLTNGSALGNDPATTSTLATGSNGDLGLHLGLSRNTTSVPTLSRGTSVVSRMDTGVGGVVATWETFTTATTPNPTIGLAATANSIQASLIFAEPSGNRVYKGRITAALDDAASA